MSRSLFYKIITTLFYGGVVIYNGTIGQGMANLRDVFPFPLMPPGRTFGLARGIIYLTLLGFIYVVRKLERNKRTQDIHHLFWISCLFNVSRLYLSSIGEYGVGVFFLLALTVTLYSLLSTIQPLFLPFPQKYLIRIPIGLYLGWLTVATFVLGGSQLLHLWGGLASSAHPYWVVSALIVISLITGRIRSRFTYPSTVILVCLALLGVILQHRTGTPRIAGTALGSGMLLVGIILWTLLSDIKKPVIFISFLILLGLFLALALLSKAKLFEGFKILWGVM